jgi:PDZ domain-containing protein
MSRRAATLVVASVLTLLFGATGALLPVPYVALMPGPTTNTLGDNDAGKPLIEVQGRQVHPVTGHLNFTTVAYRGGPGNRMDLFTALRGWLDPSVAIVPEEKIFPKSESVKQVEEENAQQMQNSQHSADGKLLKGDEVVAVDGATVRTVEEITDAMKRHKPGDKVTMTAKRAGKQVRLTMTAVRSPDDADRAVIGVVFGYRFPITVKINVGEVGGPSAGLMFSLAIIDKLTEGPLTDGRFIAGTGTITPDGEVGPIGGIQQKMVAARRAGATVFLTPADNCEEALPAAPKGLRLVKAETLHGTLAALENLRSRRGAVPSCKAA